MRLIRSSIPGVRRLDLAWAGFAGACLIAMALWPGWQALPFHLVFASLTLLYGFRAWSLGRTAAVLGAVVATTGVLLVAAAADAREWSELTEIPLLSAMFLAMVWHARRRERFEEALRDREEQLRGLVENIPGVVYRCLADPEWPMELLSDDVEQLTGYPASDFLRGGRSFASVIDPRDTELVREASDSAIGEGRPFELEYRIRHADGDVRWVHERGQAVRGPDGSVLWLDGVMLDVTERKQAEEGLRESREEYRSILESANEAFLAFDPEGRISEWNREAERMFGWARDEALGRTIVETVIPPAYHEGLAEAIAGYLETGDSPLFARRTQAAARRRDGSEFPVEFTVRAIERDGAVRLNVFVQDISERRRSEDALREAETRYRMLVENLPLVTFVDRLDDTSSVMYVSPQVEPLLGYAVDEWLEDHELLVKVLHPDDRERVLAAIARSNSSLEPFREEYRLIARDGRLVWVEAATVVIYDDARNPTGSQGYLLDVTERKRAEEGLAEAERRFRTLVEQLPLVTYVEELGEESASYVSPQIERLCGYTAEEWSADPGFFGKVLHPDDRERVLAAFARFQETEESLDYEYRLIARDGRLVWCRDSAVLVRDGEGRPLYTQGSMVDVTERRESEEAARRLAAIVESSDDAIFGATLDGVITSWNRGAEQLYGFTAEEAIGRRVSLMVPPDRAHEASALLDRLRSSARVHRYETVRLHKDGHRLDVSLTISPILDEAGAPVGASAIARDIGERKQSEAERERMLAMEREQNARLRELDRLKDEFIALVSHELRTPLTSIHGYLELVLDGEAGEVSEEQRQFLGIVARNAERLGRVVGDLLLVAQIEAGTLALELEPVSLDEVARQGVEAARLLAEKKGVELALRTAAAPSITADRARLAQVIDNLVSNAIKFTPEGGAVGVTVSPSDGAVLLEVSDTGMGIAEDEQRRLFERFFRTERATALAIPGTGLGLAIARAIVDAHGGEIRVESAVGSGTTFCVRLPLGDGRLAA